MGKSVRPKDPFAFNQDYNKEVGSVVQAPDTTKQTPFDFKPEYNLEVKKAGGNDLEAASPLPSELPSNGNANPSQVPEQIKPPSAADFLSKDVDASDFFGQLEAETQKYLPNLKPTSQVEKTELSRQTKNEILSNPEALGKYNRDRINQLNQKIKTLEQRAYEEGGYTEEIGGGIHAQQVKDKFIKNPIAYNDIKRQIQETKNYINDLKSNVAEVAGDFVASKYTPANYNPSEVGRKVVELADPDLNDQFKLVEKSGMTLPGIRAEEVKRMGIDATERYLLKQPDTPERNSYLTLVTDYKNKFDEENPNITAQRVREKIASQLYKTGKSSWLGFGYDEKTLKEAAEDPATGLTPSEKKIFYGNVLPTENKIIGTDIPTSGFTRSFSNAIEKSAINTGKSLADIVGAREEGDQAYDVLNQEVDQSRYRAPGESPTAQAQLAYLKGKEKTGKLTEPEMQTKKSLENYVGVRNNWSRFKDGAGDVTGQVIEMALLSKGVSSAGRLLMASGAEGGLLGGLTRSTIGTIASNETVGLMLNGYLNSYDNYKQEAIQLMPGEDKAAARDAYAKIMATVEGASELIFRDTKVLNAFTKKAAPAIREITEKLISGEITQQVARETLQSGLQKYLKPFAKEFIKAEIQEPSEEAVVDLARGIASSVFGGTDFDMAKTGKQALNTFLTTMLYSPLVSGMAAHGAYRQNASQNAFMKSTIVNMAANPAEYLKSVEDLQLDGTITQQQANEKIKLIKSSSEYLAELPATRQVTIKTPEGESTTQVPMDFPQVSSYLLHRMNEGIIAEQLAVLNKSNNPDKIRIADLNKQLARSGEIRKGIYDGSIGVTPDIQDVTDDFEKANELGIADSNQLTPSELIGTPFENEKGGVPRSVPRSTISENGQNKAEKEQVEEGSGNVSRDVPRQQDNLISTEITPEDNISVREMVDKKGSYKGQRGSFIQDGQAVVFKVDNSNREYELGNLEEIGEQPIEDYGIEDENTVVTIDEAGAIKVREKDYINPNEDPLKAIVRDDEGKVVAVKLQTPEGQRRTFRGQVADDLAYGITLKQITQNNEQPELEDFINTDPESIQEMEDGRLAETPEGVATENTEEVQREKIEPVKKRTRSIKKKNDEKSNSKKSSDQKTGETGKENDNDVSEKGKVTDEQEGADKKEKSASSLSTGDGTGLTHAKTAETRDNFNLGNSYQKVVVPDEELNEEADKLIAEGYNIESLIRKLERGIAPSPLETVILKKYLGALEAIVEKNPSNENLDNLLRLVKTTDAIGSEQGRAFRLRQGLQLRDDSMASFYVREQEAQGISELSEEQKEFIEKQHKEIQDTLKAIEEKNFQLEQENAKERAEQELKQTKAKKGEVKSTSDYAKERQQFLEEAKEKLKNINKTDLEADIASYENNEGQNSDSDGVVKDGDSIEVILNRIKNLKNYPNFGELAKDLLRKSDKQSLAVKVKLHPATEGKHANYEMYGPNEWMKSGDVINFYGGSENNIRIILHEVIHAMTSKKLPRDLTGYKNNYGKNYADIIKDSHVFQEKNVLKLVDLYLETVEKLGLQDLMFGENGIANNYKSYEKNDNPKKVYGLLNLDEFLSEAFTDRKFQNQLKEIKSDNKSLWDKFVAFVRDLLGVPDNILNDVLRIGENIIATTRDNARKDRSGWFTLNAENSSPEAELMAIAPEVNKMVRSLVEEGATDLDKIVSEVHKTFSEILPDITEKDIHNIIAGDYNVERKPRSVIAAKLKDLRDEASLINQLEALQNGQEPSNKRAKVIRNQKIEALKKAIKEFKANKNSPEEKTLEQTKKRLQDQIKQLEEDLANGNFALPKTKKAQKLDKEAIALKDKLIKLRMEREARLLKLEYQKKSKLQKGIDAAANVLNIPRSIMSSVDFSAPLRQAAIVTVANPKVAALAGLEMFKQAFSQKRFDRWFSDLKETDRYKIMEASGLYVSDPADPRITAREEQFMSNLAEKIPLIGQTLKFNIGGVKGKIPGLGLIKGSERAYVSYLNKMRVDLFNRYADAFEYDGFTIDNSEEMYKGLASFLNNSTGRGNLGPLETAAPVLNSMFFSPRLIASRLNIMGLGDIANPGKGYYAKMPAPVRKIALKNLAIFIGTGVTTLALLSLAYGCKGEDDKDCVQVELDPRSSDFGKIKIGKTRWDIWAGFQQYIRVASQLIAGESKSANSGKLQDLSGDGAFGRTRGDVTFGFIRGKLAPVPSFIVDMLNSQNVLGEKFVLKDAVLARVLPLTAADLYGAVKENGVKAIFTQGVPSVFGVGVQTYLPKGYEKKDLKDPTFKFLYDKNLNISTPAQKDMTDKQYDAFVPLQKQLIKQQWDEAMQYGIMLNEKGNPTIDEDAAVQIVPATKATYEQLTGLMKSISTKATKGAKADLDITQ